MWNLLADVGGTHMRIAAASRAGDILDQKSFPSKGGAGFLSACEAMIAERKSTPAAAVVAAAGVVTNGAVRLTNSEQSFSESDLGAVAGFDPAMPLGIFGGLAADGKVNAG